MRQAPAPRTRAPTRAIDRRRASAPAGLVNRTEIERHAGQLGPALQQPAPANDRGYVSIPFGDVVGHDKLPAGSYYATVSATNATGRSTPVSLRFSVAR